MPFDFVMGYVAGSRQASRMFGLNMAAESFRSKNDTNKLLDLSERIDQLVLVLEAMWSLLREQGLSDDQLRARIAEIDAADGLTDGRHSRPPEQCDGCEAMVPAGLTHCQFCGASVRSAREGTDPFTSV